MGVGANNAAIVANAGDGLLVSGSSKNTQVGGVIPLGNVISGNNRNGIEVSGTASGFVSFNTFAGTVAFGPAAPNKRDGILVTSTGGNNPIRTCIISGNLGNGIEIGGNATGVQVTDAAIGTNSSIQTAIANQGSGILISGNAHGNAIGGFQPSLEPQVTISANGRYGVEIVGSAHDNMIFHTYLGTTGEGTGDLGNGLGGVYLGPHTSSTTIGGASTELQNKIFNSLGDGVAFRSSRRNVLEGNQGQSNQGYGIDATGACTGSLVRQNVIVANTLGNVNLTNSRGITYIP
jgi:trimeric autotransporter adhesin